MKRIICFFVSAMLLISSFSININASTYISSGETGNCYWKIVKGSFGYELYISGNGKMGDYVNSVSPFSYSNERMVFRKIVIEDGVTNIGRYAFALCHFDSISISESVKRIDPGAFYYSKYCNSIIIPNSVTYIGPSAFEGCSYLKNIYLPSNVEISDYAFKRDESQSTYTALEHVWFGGLESEAQNSWFNTGNYGLMVAQWHYNTCFNYNHTYSNACDSTCNDCGCTRTVSHSYGEWEVKTKATCFSKGEEVRICSICGDEQARSISIIDHTYQSGICSMCSSADNTIWQYTISNENAIITKYTGTDINIVIPSVINGYTVTSIEDEAFCETSIQHVVLPDSITYIGRMAFGYCHNLTDVTLSTNITELKSGIFFDCKKLKKITIPEKVKTIGLCCFASCEALEEVIIPESVESIGVQVFSLCNKLSDIYYGGTEEKWNTIAINNGNDNLVNATIHYAKNIIAYDTNGGTNQPSQQIKVHGENITISSEIPERYGYTFLGWSTTQGGDVEYLPGEVYSENTSVTLYAVWNTHSHVWDGGSVTAQPTHTTYGVRTYTCQICSATKTEQIAKTTGHSYNAWMKHDADNHIRTCVCGDVQTEPHNWGSGVISKQPTHTTYGERTYTCYDCSATRTEQIDKIPTYIISYNANGGTDAPSDQITTQDTSLTLSLTAPIRTGYTFLGWATSSTSTFVMYKPGDTLSAENNVTLYAVWKANTYTISYNANGGTYIMSNQIKTHDKNLILHKVSPSKTGYRFRGWTASSSANYVTYLPGDTFTANADTTLYAVWQANTYTVSYNSNGGSGTMSNSFHIYDSSKNLSSNTFSRNGYTFLGWSTSSSATSATYTNGQSVMNLTSTKDATITLYAVWQQNVVLSSISINRYPTKTTYFVGDTFSSNGLVIKLTYSDGTTQNITSGFTTSGFSSTTSGTKTITVEYGNLTTSFDVNIIEKSITGIEITTLPSKLTYLEGDEFDPAGLTVKALYDNGDSENVTDYTVTGYDSTPGSKVITVAYNNFKATFNVQVQAKSLTDIVITSAPAKVEYIEGQIFDATGLVITANYNNGTSEEITNYSLSGYKNTVGTHTVTVTYGGKTATFEVKVIARVVTALEVTKMPNKIEYLEGDEIVLAGLEVVATYNDGTTEKVTDYIYNGYDSTPGEKTISVMYSGCTASFTVNVKAKSFTHITITYPTKLTYFVGEEIDTTGLTVTAFYDNGTSEVIESGKYLVEGFESSAVGTKEITVSYNGKTQSFSVTIVEAPKTFVYGDVTGEGKINLADVSLMLKKIAKWDVTLDSDAADVTGDGKINLADVSLLLKYIAKWDVVLGKA